MLQVCAPISRAELVSMKSRLSRSRVSNPPMIDIAARSDCLDWRYFRVSPAMVKAIVRNGLARTL